MIDDREFALAGAQQELNSLVDARFRA